MDTEVLKLVGQIAGIGGLGLGVLFLLYRDIIRKNIFPSLPPAEAYRLLRLITIAVWSVAVIGIAVWFFSGTGSKVSATDGSIGVVGDVTNSAISNTGN